MAAMNMGEAVRFSLTERVTAAIGDGVVDLFEVHGSPREVVLSLRSLDELDALPAVRDTLDHAGFEAVNLGNGEIVVSEVA